MKKFGAFIVVCQAMLALSANLALGQGEKTAYPNEQPLDTYLSSDPNAEIALARSAAPPSISRNAEVLVLDRQGYRTAIKGSNGFVCLVERAWMSPFDRPEFWNPKVRGPICYNPPAAQTILPYTLKRTTLVLAGFDKNRILDGMRAAAQRHQLPEPTPGAMSYMMSKDGYLGDGVGHWHSHLMFHVARTPQSDSRVSQTDTALWGANLGGSPVMVDTNETVVPEPETIFMIAVDHWSDGTPAPMPH